MKKTLKADVRPSILFVLPTLGTGGSERVVFNLCLHLKHHCSPVVAAFRGGALSHELAEAGIDHYVLERSGGIDFSLIFKLIRIIRKHSIRVVNCHHFVALFYTFWAARLTHIPLMHTEHSKWEMEGLSLFWKFCFHILLKYTNVVTAVSQASFAHLRDIYHIPDNRLKLILNGIDVKRFKLSSQSPLLRSEVGLLSTDFVIGTVGNLRIEKNQALLLRTIALLSEDRKDLKAVLVGDGPCRESLIQLAKDLNVEDKVVFLGTRNDVDKLYGLFDIYVLPSRYEGLPLTLLEAMSAGIPVVGTNVLGIREVIDNGECGILVDDNKPESLAEALLLLERDTDKRNNLIKCGRKLVEEKYSLDKFVSCYDEIFRGLTV